MDRACSTNGEKRNAYKILEDQGVGGWTIIKWILER
jgi:hypothetical protein